MRPFEPLFRNSHLQTILGSFWPRPFDSNSFPATASFHRTEPDTQVLVHSQQPRGQARGTLLLVHGLEGSSDAGYMRSAAHAALQAGFVVHRMNIRTCGGTEALCQTLYHAGLTSDLKCLVQELSATAGPIFLAGFSLGANQCLKLAGELGREGPRFLAGVIGVSTPIDLAACSRALGTRPNWLYEKRFLRNMVARLERRCQTQAEVFGKWRDAARHARSIWELDDQVTARFFGFGSAERYYGTQSSRLFLESIRVPALLIQSQDDPMIPFEVYRHPAFETNRQLRLVAPEHGGHVGFLNASKPRLWLDGLICDWMLETGNKLQGSLVS